MKFTRETARCAGGKLELIDGRSLRETMLHAGTREAFKPQLAFKLCIICSLKVSCQTIRQCPLKPKLNSRGLSVRQ